VLEVLSTVQRRAKLHTLELKVGLKKHRFKNGKKNLDSYYFVTLLDILSFKK
jgi:hypothetical protein